MKRKKVVLAFSGGLDTSYCAVYLSAARGMEVHSVLVNCGGFSADELATIARNAYELGVASHTTIDAVGEFYRRCIRYLVFGNVLKNHAYPLSVSAERVFQALEIARHAREIGAEAIAHGSTGAGNDQVRFDVVFHIEAPGLEIITPVRDDGLSRADEIAFLLEHGVRRDWKKAAYSVNQGLWGTTVGGKETLTSHSPLPDDAYPTPVSAAEPETIDLRFEKGEIQSINGRDYSSPTDAIRELNALGAPYGIGRGIHVGDTVIGIKGRVGFEAPAPMLLIKAHQALEKHVLTKWQIHWKDQLAAWYGMMLHEGQFLDPVMRDIERFLSSNQQVVNGVVHVRLQQGYFDILGVTSPNDLMSERFGKYGEKNTAWSGQDVRGFARIMANQSLMYRMVNGEDDHD